MQNLCELISDEDKECMLQWINSYTKCHPLNIDTVLRKWSENKKTLYRALGQNLRITYPIKIKKDEKVFYRELAKIYKPLSSEMTLLNNNNYLQYEILEDNHIFIKDLYNFFSKWYSEKKDFISFEIKTNFQNLSTLLCYDYIQHNEYKGRKGLVFYRQDGKTKTIKHGARAMRAIQGVLKFLNFDKMESFNKWRNAISDLNNARSIDCNLVFSIHPLDFMTMSDNSCNWSSCMSWKGQGSYSSGTIEMLNSNNTMVVYLESPKPFIWNDHIIPNKSWRCLFYVHKDIICLGKSYPYYHKELDLTILKIAQQFLKQNLNWKYQYQYQQYKDLKHIYSNNYIRQSIYAHRKRSHKIFLYTYGMYADLVEDQTFTYWCCRNWVKDDLKICVSGRATCMNCGEYLDEDLEDLEYSLSARKYCHHCGEQFECSTCGSVDATTKHYKILLYKNYIGFSFLSKCYSIVCEECFLNDLFYDKTHGFFVHLNDRPIYERKIVCALKPLVDADAPIEWVRAAEMIGSDKVVQC